ncbi:hypothetical protein T03_3470 [Trichinella britovi]|uniref:Uncharacterized protein n=1 Tax=Trichinella britovi TaxID=45882 RepID=A0A0V1CHR2_TRIBR|nr:hypothetical protein T03_3470 [Trichinella britovi]
MWHQTLNQDAFRRKHTRSKSEGVPLFNAFHYWSLTALFYWVVKLLSYWFSLPNCSLIQTFHF